MKIPAQGLEKQKAYRTIHKLFHLLLAVFWGCTSLWSTQPAQAAFPGIDGSLTVTAANTILNQYDTVTSISGNTITVSNIGNLSSSVVSSNGVLGLLAPGDLLMVYQAQGATIDTTNTASYGNVSSYNSAGRYEFVTVGSISGNTITLATACGNLKNTYASTLAQVIRVPQFSNLTIDSGASVTAPAWNGSTGAIVAVHVQGTTTINGQIDLVGKGFRGGAIVNNSGNNAGSTTYRSNGSYTAGGYGSGGFPEDNVVGGEKGEGIAGSQTNYDALNGRYGRGAPGNGGGGGTGHNAGGGGGANGNNGVTWNGLGNPDNSVASWVTAWGREAAATRPTSSSGGGRGGYTFSFGDQDATKSSGAPGNTNWGGDNRRSVGGLGGRPLDYSGGAQARLFFGGGGGSGDGNNSAAGAGGNGGGLAYLIANTVTGSGSIQANGTNGTSTTSGGNDAPGGGGAGGTVVLQATSSVAINANGGNGGNQNITTNEAEGPGGGGGGGYIAASGGTQTVNAGVNGTTNSPALTEFPPNGATRGATGQTATPPISANIPLCYTPQIGVAKILNGSIARDSSSSNFIIPFSITVQNFGDVSLSSSQITENLASAFPPGATFSIASAPTVIAGKALALNPSFNGGTNTNLLASGQTLGTGEQSTIAFSVQVTPDPSKSFGPYSNQVTGSATGTTPAGSSFNTTALSDNGTAPDPNGNGLPNETGEDDPTPVQFTHLRLVKRITGIKKGSVLTAITTYNDLGTDPNDNATVSWPGGAATYLKGAFDGAQIPTPTPGLPGPQDEVEYTIYFLSDGGANANNLNLCDFVPASQQFVSGTIQLNIGGTTTNIADGSGLGPGSGFYNNTNTSFPAACPVASNKAEGAVYVQVGAAPTVTKTPTPTNYYGFLRFRAKVR
jgi:uncharacterized repeat protein (TIGR01451 family)